MAKFNVGDKVSVPGTIVSLTADESGEYYEVKVRANNKIVHIRCEEEDISAVSDSSTTDDSSTDPVTPPEP